MTQSNSVDWADSVQLTRLLQCCMKLCNNEGGYTRPQVGQENILQLGALEVRMRLEQLRVEGSWVFVSVYLRMSSDTPLASHGKLIVAQLVGAISKKIILITTRSADSLLQDIELRS